MWPSRERLSVNKYNSPSLYLVESWLERSLTSSPVLDALPPEALSVVSTIENPDFPHIS